MRVMIIGSGGREHALAWKLFYEGHVIIGAPGNPGILKFGQCLNVAVDERNELIQISKKFRPDLVLIGPEDPICNGLADELKVEGLKVFAPSQSAAKVESSKIFAKRLMNIVGVPTAPWRSFDNPNSAEKYVRSAINPQVIKVDGLARGKGVKVCNNQVEAVLAVEELSEKYSGQKLIVEERLYGPECSVFVITDGENFAIFPPITDYKAICEDGENTGGMGSIYPTKCEFDGAIVHIIEEIISPVLRKLKRDGVPFVGCLYIGLILCDEKFYVLEFNCRFGDPETQVAMKMLDEPLLELLYNATIGKIQTHKVAWKEGACVCVVASSKGYPGKSEVGKKIIGLGKVKSVDAEVFFSGVNFDIYARGFLTSGGRVLSVVARGDDLVAASNKAYNAISKIHFDGMYYRRDIGRPIPA